LVLNDQRRAFSTEYENFQLLECDCYVEVCSRNKLSSLERVTLEDLKRTPCILISSREQQDIEQEYYQNTLTSLYNVQLKIKPKTESQPTIKRRLWDNGRRFCMAG